MNVDLCVRREFRGPVRLVRTAIAETEHAVAGSQFDAAIEKIYWLLVLIFPLLLPDFPPSSLYGIPMVAVCAGDDLQIASCPLLLRAADVVA